MPAILYLIPTVLSEGQTKCLPSYLLDVIKTCKVLFVENERTARRFLKQLSTDIVIDNYQWYNMKEPSAILTQAFKEKIKEQKSIGLISEAGCPGVADPGQLLVGLAHQMQVTVRPLVGPSAILLALMASGMNGQHFHFVGYLPIAAPERIKAIKSLENESKLKSCTQIFIETPYRNNQLMETILKTCSHQTSLCIAVDLTAENEWIQTQTIQLWKMKTPDLHKRPALFLLYASHT
ncbi:MAG: SAM-dependent methyltransferase [Flavisolibacter sp.]